MELGEALFWKMSGSPQRLSKGQISGPPLFKYKDYNPYSTDSPFRDLRLTVHDLRVITTRDYEILSRQRYGEIHGLW